MVEAEDQLPGTTAKVSCIMPTADRRRFVDRSIELFLAQDYPDKELVILDDGADPVADLVPDDTRIRYVRHAPVATIGEKRNRACEAAHGDIIAHWDDDDWYAPWRLSYQAEALMAGADICGLDRILYADEAGSAWEYVWPARQGAWLHGATLCYRRTLWQRHRFAPLSIGEDTAFLQAHAQASTIALPRAFYVGRMHADNTSRKLTTDPRWHRRMPADIDVVMTSRACSTALVAIAGGIGDVIRATPLIRVLHGLGHAVDVLLAAHSREAGDLLRGAPEIGRVIAVPGLPAPNEDRHLSRRPSQARASPAALAGITYDLAVFTYWAAPLVTQVRARRVDQMEPDSWLAHGDSACVERLARRLGWSGAMPAPFAIASARQFGLPPGTVALHPGCKPDWPWKRWHGFEALATMLPSVVVVGTQADRDNSATYFARDFTWPPHVRDFTGALSLADTAALIGQCDALVANDSGLMHLGAALGIRTLGVFGITSPAREAIPGTSTIAITKGLSCEPACRREAWGRSDCAAALQCLKTLTAEEVLERLQGDGALPPPPESARKLAPEPAPEPPEPALRVTYSAEVFNATGYGEAARRYIHALHHAGVAVSVIDTGARPAAVEDPLIASLLGADEAADFDIFHGIPSRWAREAFSRRRVIAVTVWETDTMPPQWRGVLTHAADVWLPCRFNVEVFASGLGRTPFLLPHALRATAPSDRSAPARQEPALQTAHAAIRHDDVGLEPLVLEGVGPADFVVYAIFEWQDRKNPDGMLEAFLNAFPRPCDAVLVLKCGPSARPAAQAALAAAQQRTGGRGRVVIAAEAWPPGRVAALQRRGDCYLSLHRGEGWNYPLFEAAASGTPVIATGYSGPLDYLSADAHWLVRHRLAPVLQSYAYYQPSMRWAEPDLYHATEGLRWVHANRAAAKARAEAEAARLCDAYGIEQIGRLAKARLLALRALHATPAAAAVTRAPRLEPKPPPIPIPGSWYDADYFEHGRTSNWHLGYRWPLFQAVFRETAAWLTNCFPEARTALDIGCAKGFLVRALRERGVRAWGFDHSGWAIGHAEPAARPYLRLAGVDDPAWEEPTDLAIAMNVLESLTPSQLAGFLGGARQWVRQGLVAIIARPGPSADRDPTRITPHDRTGWRSLFLACGWQQDAIHRRFEAVCAAHDLPQRMGWDVHVYSPGP